MAGVAGRTAELIRAYTHEGGEAGLSQSLQGCRGQGGGTEAGPQSSWIPGFHSWLLDFNPRVRSMCLGDLVLGQL